MAACSVIAILATQASGATGSAAGPLAPLNQARELTASPRVAPEKCPDARNGLRYYVGRYKYWRARAQRGSAVLVTHSGSCVRVRHLAELWRGKARGARHSYLKWSYEYEWRRWLPRLWVAIGMCETQLNWQHNSGTYQGAFGFWYGTWDSYKPRGAPSEAYLASPREQYQAALNVAARVGLNAWGCYSHGGYRYHL